MKTNAESWGSWVLDFPPYFILSHGLHSIKHLYQLGCLCFLEPRTACLLEGLAWPGFTRHKLAIAYLSCLWKGMGLELFLKHPSPHTTWVTEGQFWCVKRIQTMSRSPWRVWREEAGGSLLQWEIFLLLFMHTASLLFPSFLSYNRNNDLGAGSCAALGQLITHQVIYFLLLSSTRTIIL